MKNYGIYCLLLLCSQVCAMDGYLTALSESYLGQTRLLFRRIADVKDKKKLTEMLETYKNRLDEQDTNEESLLWFAVRENNIELIQQIIKKFPSILKLRDWHGNSIFHYCAQHNKKRALETLLTSIEYIYSFNDEGNTPLHEAALNGNEEIVKLLLESKQPHDLWWMNNNNEDMLTILMKKGFDKLVQELLIKFVEDEDFSKQKNEQEEKGTFTSTWCTLWSLLIDKMNSEDFNFSEHIKDYKININLKDLASRGVLHWVVNWGSIELLKEMLAIETIEVNAQDEHGNTPLYYACARGDFEKAAVLIAHGADDELMNEKNIKAWHAQSTSFVSRLYKTLFNDTYKMARKALAERKMLFVALDNDDLKKIERLVKKGIDLSQKNIDGLNPYQCAVKYKKSASLVSYLDHAQYDNQKILSKRSAEQEFDIQQLMLTYEKQQAQNPEKDHWMEKMADAILEIG